MARKNPTHTPGLRGTTKKIMDTELPNAAGVSSDALEHGNAMMEDINRENQDGDNPKIGSAPFANGTDKRNRPGGSTSNDPTPAMPGA